ncbi:MAG TPA: bifunctional DNA-binding transcriptional regulator/O6-methylguanine-DNA methyltransferase Ada [Pyrinomonadaceae bacterium]|nr:bifunctional DNA-binding transcriptional regulator/O6-methylguanine-DNA methyltransferase Ada [Chloracidobacterium sp.]MBP9934515.1 bifunctional DNA-binding transcriptional regulator/O6-methylguanine-DNA methyltransferase Ada [Pyrinomonadaceae bacterium]MBL0240027.1 bifunctional DNA-binding transcriptional regulator/O6-methylguanine-DNA methyltransferase Ada [Chloracidobacterium sp.]HQX54937.1 bifunctional DNA-binding transcriptional regulator/O6-methylguanine-DNA methyltransferase Ada [Pyrin
MENVIFWQAVEANDSRFDGVFFFGVRTTGIYCRPSCRARLPKRENVEFYPNAKLAEDDGFRACLRCVPQNMGEPDTRTVKILRACELIDANDAVTLDRLASELDVSPYHLQRSFKQIIGVSPKKYAEAKRMERFKRQVRGGSDIVTAIYESGFGSSSRLYEKAWESLGMTPSEYKKGGKGMMINYTVTDCKLGRLLVAATSNGLCAVAFADTDTELVQNLRLEYPNADIAEDVAILKRYVQEVLEHLAGDKSPFALPLDVRATAFQLQVWELLRRIPFGETVSYGQIAEMLGDKKKVRAVARACATNRVAVVIPCHRVVAADGKLSGYRWGIERKRKLLELELELKGKQRGVQD